MNHAVIKKGLPRLIEVVASGIGLLLVAPLIGLMALAIALSSPGPVFFRQNRVGLNGRIFLLCKLRTMQPTQKGLHVTASDDARVTAIGRVLRKTKLDELPELWNILKGDMSFVGPRPEVPRYVNYERELWQLVLRVRPGLTDPVTIGLRNEEALLATIEGDREAFYLDVLQPFKLIGYLEYLRNRSPRNDVRVLWKTFIAVLLPNQSPPPTISEIKTSLIGYELRDWKA